LRYKNGKHYRKLELDFPITEELDNAINVFMDHINNGDGNSEDCYRCEIQFWLKDAKDRLKLSCERYDMLNNYYVLGDIYDHAE